MKSYKDIVEILEWYQKNDIGNVYTREINILKWVLDIK